MSHQPQTQTLKTKVWQRFDISALVIYTIEPLLCNAAIYSEHRASVKEMQQ